MQRIIDLLKTVDRPGVDSVVKYIQDSNFATARCGRHHTYKGGLVDHSLEVYEFMKHKYSDRLPDESIIICSLLHDLDKAKLRGWYFSGHHPARVIPILERCGFELTADEAFAIRNHHHKSGDILSHPYRRALTDADTYSTGEWRKAHCEPTPQDLLLELFRKIF